MTLSGDANEVKWTIGAATSSQLLDRTIIWNQAQLERLVVDYIDHYNTLWGSETRVGADKG